MNRIFVSSTCYDLIDCRSEVEACFNDMGLTPVMSDRSTTDFQSATDCNSIERCLVNLEGCDATVFILSQRYGPSLKSAGFDDISATHLEYEHARTHRKPIYFYIRDRLEADYRTWKKNRKRNDVEFAWIQRKLDERLVHFIDEHTKLAAKSEHNNWIDTFRDSTDLKRILRRDFRAPASRAEIERVIRAGELPSISLHLKLDEFQSPGIYIPCLQANIEVKNSARLPGYNVRVEGFKDDEEAPITFPVINGGDSRTVRSMIVAPPVASEYQLHVFTQLANGHWMEDSYDVGFRCPANSPVISKCMLTRRRVRIDEQPTALFEIVE